jgi:ubiquinone/menaquinone biosynthesis C-methylase UbiE
VLEIGAGDGSNLIPMALAYPEGRFVGFDLAAAPVRRGLETIAALGLSNIRLFQADITSIALEPETFDYVIAHGIYSWVPDHVRDAMMRLVRRSLAPQGVAFVSYNALPGSYVRLAIRRDLLLNVRGVAGRTAKVEAAMRRLQSWPDPSRQQKPFQRAMAEEADQMRRRSFAALAHDELSDVYHPVYLEDFADHCAANDLKILVESDPKEIGAWFAPPTVTERVEEDVLARAQQSDIAGIRLFHQSLLVRRETDIHRRPRTALLGGLHVSLRARRSADGRFSSEGGVSFSVPDPAMADTLERLAGMWPSTAPVASLGFNQAGLDALAGLYALDAVELVAAPSRFITRPGERPAASPLARLQARRGDARLTTLRHTMTDVDNDFTRDFVAALDGGRTRVEIARDIAPHFNLAPPAAADGLNTLLEVLARTPLLIQ